MPAPVKINKDFFLRRIRVDRETGCWIWIGAKTAGYGSVRINYEHVSAHRLSYEFFIGEIPDGYIVRHLCSRRDCICPIHLETGTYTDNLLDRYHGTRRRY